MSKQINDLNKSLEEQLHLNEKQEKTDTNLKTNDKTIVGAINELFQNVDSGKQLIADAIGDSSITKDSTFQAMSNAIAGRVKPAGTAVASNVLSGKTFINSTGQVVTGTMANMSTHTQVADYVAWNTQSIYLGIPAGAYINVPDTGYPEVYIEKTRLDSNLVPGNIVSGKSICGVNGTATVSNLGGCSVVAGNTFLVVEKQLSDSSSLSTSETSYTISSIPQGVVRVNINITTAGTVQQGPICNFYHNGQLIAGNITGRRGYVYDNNFDIQIKNGDVFKIDMTPKRTSTNNYCKMKIYFSLS